MFSFRRNPSFAYRSAIPAAYKEWVGDKTSGDYIIMIFRGLAVIYLDIGGLRMRFPNRVGGSPAHCQQCNEYGNSRHLSEARDCIRFGSLK